MKTYAKHFLAACTLTGLFLCSLVACSPPPGEKAPATAAPKERKSEAATQPPTATNGLEIQPTRQGELQKVPFDPQGNPKYNFKEIKNFSEIDPIVFEDELKEGEFLLVADQYQLDHFQGAQKSFPENKHQSTLASYNLKENSLTYLEQTKDPQAFIALARSTQDYLVWLEAPSLEFNDVPVWKLMVKDLKDGSIQQLKEVHFDNQEEAIREKPVDRFPESLLIHKDRCYLIYPLFEGKNWYSCIAYIDLKSGAETILEKTDIGDAMHAQLSVEKTEGKTILWNRLSEVNQDPTARTYYKICAICSHDPADQDKYKVVADDNYYFSPLQYGDSYYAIQSVVNPKAPKMPKQIIVEFKNGQKRPLIDYELSSSSAEEISYSLFYLAGNKRFMGVQQSGGLPILYEPATGKLVEISDYEVDPKGYYQLVNLFDHYAFFRLPSDDPDVGNFSVLHLPE